MLRLALVLCLGSCATTRAVEAARALPGPANLRFACSGPGLSCETPGYVMEVMGDQVERCDLPRGGQSVKLTVRSSNAPGSSIVVAIDRYHGPGQYWLDDPERNFVRIDDDVELAQCTGVTTVRKRVFAGDASCGSPSCSVLISDADVAGPYPKQLTFSVNCDRFCEHGTSVICEGPVKFVTRADCS